MRLRSHLHPFRIPGLSLLGLLLAGFATMAYYQQPALAVRALGYSTDPDKPGLRIELRKRHGGVMTLTDPSSRVTNDPEDTFSCHVWWLDWKQTFGAVSRIELTVPPKFLNGPRLGILYTQQPSAFVEDCMIRAGMTIDGPEEQIAWVENYAPPAGEILAAFNRLAE